MRQLNVFLLLLLWALPAPVMAQSRFDKATNLSAGYVESKDKVKIKWKKVSGAENYRVLIKDSLNETIAKAKTKRSKKTFDESLFTIGEEYSVRVKVLKSGSVAASKNKKIAYTHSLEESGGGSGGGEAATGNISVKNSADRSGKYYLPTGYKSTPVPVMVAFHGTGGKGNDMVSAFSGLAEQHKFIIVAPSSRKSPSGDYTWEVGTVSGEVTEDMTHAMSCLNEVLGLSGVQMSETKVLASGYSGGGSMAPYLTTNRDSFTHFASLHGGLFVGGLGDRMPSGWFSTGKSDDLRTPTEVKGYKTQVENLGFTVEYHGYSSGHDLGSTEKEELIAWWLSD